MGNIARTEAELFGTNRSDTKPRLWKKGQITNPTWLANEIGYDYVVVQDQREFNEVVAYLEAQNADLAVPEYNCYSTGRDKADNPMICLYDMDDSGDQHKRAIIIIKKASLVMAMVEAVEANCTGENQ